MSLKPVVNVCTFIFMSLQYGNELDNNMTRTGAKHTSKDNETHTLPQKAVSTTSCDSLL